MKKSLLTASVLSAVAAIASTSAFADNTSTYCKPGFYAGVQGGRGDTFYNPSNTLTQPKTAEIASLPAVGSIVNNDEITATSASFTQQDVDDTGLAGRLYAGYQFNPYFAMEAGYTQFSKTEFSMLANTSVTTLEGTGDTNSSTYYNGDISEHAVDLSAKGTLPLQYGFGLYVKAGLSYIQADRYVNAFTNAGATTTNVNAYNVPVETTYSQTYQAVRPNYGGGIDYTIPNTNVDVEIFYNEIAGAGAIPTASMWGGGLAYKFA